MISVNNISKKYNEKLALDNFSGEFYKGMSIGVIGHNGAGKTTLLQILAHIIKPSSGQIKFSQTYRVGWTGQNTVIDWFLTSYSNVLLGAKLAGFNSKKSKEITEKFLKMMDLWDGHDDNPDSLSGGQQQRLQIARILAYNPDVLFLDEPTTGLDVVCADSVMKTCLQNECENKIAFVSSHDLGLIEKYCSHIILLKNGKVLFFDRRDKFLKIIENKKIMEIEIENLSENFIEIIKNNIFEILEIIKNKIIISMSNKENITDVINIFSLHNIKVINLYERQLSVKDAYIQIMK